MITSRFPPEDATAFASPQSVELASGERATISWEPDRSGTTFFMHVLAVSKAADTTYEVRCDGRTVFGPAAIPPTDIDDLKAVWDPPQTFDTDLTLIIKNLGTGSRTYHAQPVGFETQQGVQ